VSPLSTTEEIKAFVLTKRSKAQASKRSRGDDDFGAAEAEMTRLQDLEEEIGTPRAGVADTSGQRPVARWVP
jgi:hypothetical protein